MKHAEINTRKGKRIFIRSLCRSIEREARAAVPRMPTMWDGNELREMLAGLFNHERTRIMRADRSRMKAYRGDCYNRNLP